MGTELWLVYQVQQYIIIIYYIKQLLFKNK